MYLISYRGNKLPPFYIGSSSIKRIEKGYMGSVASKRYKALWKDELENNRNLFNINIVTIHETREDAYKNERKFQETLNVLKNPLYVNCHISNTKFRPLIFTDEIRKKISDGKKGKCSPSLKTREKLRNINLGKKQSIETKEKIAAAHRGKKHSKETCIKLSLSLKGKGLGQIPWNRRSVVANFIEYPSIKKAAEALIVDSPRILYRIKKNYPGYYYP